MKGGPMDETLLVEIEELETKIAPESTAGFLD
jgi:hypothetical protein